MKKQFTTILLFLCTLSVMGQRDSLPLGTKYREDQLYLAIQYNLLANQPPGVSGSGFSYSLGVGAIKDIPLNRQGSWALGLGLGYAYDFFNHGLQVSSQSNADLFSIDDVLDSNTIGLHSLEFPFEIRWRNSNAQRYKFWRVYPGFKLSYNLSNRFEFIRSGETIGTSNIDSFRDWQYGLTLSVGYDSFNLNLYYGLTSILENASLNGNSIDTRIVKIGVIIYIL